MRALLILPLLAILLSGCAVDQGDPETEDADSSSSMTSSATLPPTTAGSSLAFEDVSVNATGLDVAFLLAVSAGNASTPTWSIAFGDNQSANGTMRRGVAVNETVVPAGNDTTAGNGTTYLANHTHSYAAEGTYNVTVVVRDGASNVTRVLNVTVGGDAAPSAATQAPLQLSGDVVCLPTVVVNGEILGDSQSFTVEPGQVGFVLTFLYDESTGVEDLDITLVSPSGKELESAEAGPEPPMTVASPEAGEWTLDVTGYSCAGEASYTADILFG